MAVYYSLAYGVALTDQFGEKLEAIPQELFDFAKGPVNYGSECEVDDAIQSMPTAGDYAMVLGVNVPQGPDDGVTWAEESDALADIHQAYLAGLQRCPAAIQQQIQELNLAPRLCVLAGNF
jgi:hypothetical protein